MCTSFYTKDIYLTAKNKGVLFHQVPRMLLEHKHHKKTWKRKEIGIRLPNAPVLLELLNQLDGYVSTKKHTK